MPDMEVKVKVDAEYVNVEQVGIDVHIEAVLRSGQQLRWPRPRFMCLNLTSRSRSLPPRPACPLPIR